MSRIKKCIMRCCNYKKGYFRNEDFKYLLKINFFSTFTCLVYILVSLVKSGTAYTGCE